MKCWFVKKLFYFITLNTAITQSFDNQLSVATYTIKEFIIEWRPCICIYMSMYLYIILCVIVYKTWTTVLHIFVRWLCIAYFQLDTVCRLLIDRQWSVGELTGAVLCYLQTTLSNPNPSETISLFDFLISSKKKTVPSQYFSTEHEI